MIFDVSESLQKPELIWLIVVYKVQPKHLT